MTKLMALAAIYAMLTGTSCKNLDQIGTSHWDGEPEPYYVTVGSMGGAFMFLSCHEWNAVEVVEKRYHVKLLSHSAGCFGPTEEQRRQLAVYMQQNERLDESFRELGLLPPGGSVEAFLDQEFRRQYQLDSLVRQQAFLKEEAAKGSGPVFIRAEPLPDIGAYQVSFFQEDSQGELFRIGQAYVDLSASAVKRWHPGPIPANYPWSCYVFSE